MSYTITISMTETVNKLTGGDWKVVGQEHHLDALQNAFRDAVGAAAVQHLTVNVPVRNVYGYTPPVEKRVEVTTELLRQTVPALDLEAVIKAVNQIK